MNTNDVWDLEVIPNGAKTVGCYQVYRQNVTPKGMQKDIKHDLWQYTLCKEDEYITMRVFSPGLCKDSFRIIMVLMAHYDVELHQMDVKAAFLNGDLYKNVYMA